MNIKIIILLILLLSLCSCHEKCGSTGFEKLDYMSEPQDSDSWVDCYAINCFDTGSRLKIDTVRTFILQNYSHELARRYKHYQVVIYNYDANCEDGLKNSYECAIEVGKGNVNYKVYMDYIWENGVLQDSLSH